MLESTVNVIYLCFSWNWSHMFKKTIKMGDHDKYANLDCVYMIFRSWNGLRYKTLKIRQSSHR
jgi:hypothetical protein